MNQKNTNSTLHQECNARGEQRDFEIYNEKFIKVSTSNILGKSSYHINLTMLAPWPVRQRQVSWQWLMAVGYFSFTTLAYIVYLFYIQESQKVANLVPFIIIFLLLSLGTFIMFLYKSPNVMEFRSRYGNCTVFSLLHNKPGKEEFKSYIEEIKLRSLTASQHTKINKAQMLNIEKNELERIHNEGIISTAEYEEAKARMMQVHIQ